MPHSGKHGIVHSDSSAVTFVRNWSIEDSMTPETYVASNTKGGQFANTGVVDWSGSFAGFGGYPGIFPGDIVDFEGYSAPSDDTFGSNGKVYSGSAIIDSLTINWGWEAGQTLGWTANFSAASAGLTISDDILTDVNLTIPQKMCGLTIEYATDADVEPSYDTWLNVISASLTFTSDNQSYVNSYTSCFTHRVAGNLSWEASITEQEEAQLISKGTRNRLKMYVTASTFWKLEFGLLTGYSGFNVDIESGAIISKSADYIMCGSNSSVTGAITDPGTNVKWTIS